jgi:hypothetical protein
VRKSKEAAKHFALPPSPKGVLGLGKVEGRQQYVCRQVRTSSNSCLEPCLPALRCQHPTPALLLQLPLLSCQILHKSHTPLSKVWPLFHNPHLLLLLWRQQAPRHCCCWCAGRSTPWHLS